MARVMKADQLAAGGPVRVQAMNLRDLADQARTIVLEARKEAAAILAQAQTQAAKTRQEAAQAAEVEGFAKGHAAGLAQGADHGRQTAQTQFRAEVAELSDLAKAMIADLLDIVGRITVSGAFGRALQ